MIIFILFLSQLFIPAKRARVDARIDLSRLEVYSLSQAVKAPAEEINVVIVRGDEALICWKVCGVFSWKQGETVFITMSP